MKYFRGVLLGICVIVFLFSGYKILEYYISSADNQNYQEALVGNTDNPSKIDKNLKRLKKKNKDFYALLVIKGTKYRFLVVYAPKKEDYYLHRNFDGKESKYGTIFVDNGCSIAPKSDNLIFHGHHMRDGSMFGFLSKYENKDFYDKHKRIKLYTLEGNLEYEIFSVIKTDVYDDKSYLNFVDAENEENFNDRVQYFLEKSLYKTGVSLKYGDKMISLSTCNYHTQDGRLGVLAKEIS